MHILVVGLESAPGFPQFVKTFPVVFIIYLAAEIGLMLVKGIIAEISIITGSGQ